MHIRTKPHKKHHVYVLRHHPNLFFQAFFWEGVGTESDSDTDGLEEPSVRSNPFCKLFCIVAVPNVKRVERVTIDAFTVGAFLCVYSAYSLILKYKTMSLQSSSIIFLIQMRNHELLCLYKLSKGS